MELEVVRCSQPADQEIQGHRGGGHDLDRIVMYAGRDPFPLGLLRFDEVT
jgi:hypothetical protein